MKYCTNCGRKLVVDIPSGDDRDRYMCGHCGTVHYQNPKVVVGCISTYGDRVLLCKRAIEPMYGKWTIPAGYLENYETVEAAAYREAYEEARISLGKLTPYRLFNIVHIAQVYLIFRSELAAESFSPGAESLDVDLFAEAEIPWDEIAFRVVDISLKNYFTDRTSGVFSFKIGDIQPSPDP